MEKNNPLDYSYTEIMKKKIKLKNLKKKKEKLDKDILELEKHLEVQIPFFQKMLIDLDVDQSKYNLKAERIRTKWHDDKKSDETIDELAFKLLCERQTMHVQDITDEISKIRGKDVNQSSVSSALSRDKNKRFEPFDKGYWRLKSNENSIENEDDEEYDEEDSEFDEMVERSVRYEKF